MHNNFQLHWTFKVAQGTGSWGSVVKITLIWQGNNYDLFRTRCSEFRTRHLTQKSPGLTKDSSAKTHDLLPVKQWLGPTSFSHLTPFVQGIKMSSHRSSLKAQKHQNWKACLFSSYRKALILQLCFYCFFLVAELSLWIIVLVILLRFCQHCSVSRGAHKLFF